MCRQWTRAKHPNFMDRQIVRPILQSGSPRRVHFKIPRGFAENPVSTIFPIGRQITSLDIRTPVSSTASYTFDSLVLELRSTPHLVNLHFPWPDTTVKSPRWRKGSIFGIARPLRPPVRTSKRLRFTCNNMYTTEMLLHTKFDLHKTSWAWESPP